jgi:UDP-N-acetylglucosamine--N-acetylmuramyl-(pentapeptide) pyrophosphoryl-undecaprenol N-acetylglucosamine transferase
VKPENDKRQTARDDAPRPTHRPSSIAQPRRTALVMAGGTGGHVMPALAVAELLRDEGWRVVWLGTRAGMEAKLAVEKGFEMAWVKVAGVRGKGALSKLVVPLFLVMAFWQAARALFRERPDVALGLGGYVAFPGGMMASLFGKPLVIHEQNAIAGLTNRLLACLADRVLTGMPAAFTHVNDKPLPCGKVESEWTGNPVRPEIAALPEPAARYRDRAGPLRLLVVGGSLGAAALNTMVPRALAHMPADARPEVRHQSGAKHLDALRENYASAGVEAECLAFIDDMAAALDWADAVICRAGALTVAEIAASGSAALFVPYPFAVDDHQRANARILADVDAAWLMPQDEMTADSLAAWFAGLTRDELLARAEKARTLAKPHATARVAAVVKELAK